MLTGVFSSRLRTLAVLVAAALSLSLVACGDDEGGGEGAQQIAITVSDATKGAPGQGKTTVEAPATAETGLAEITLENSAKGEADVQLIRTTGDHSAAETLKNVAAVIQGKALPDWFFGGGGVPATPSGASQTVTQVLEPGTYYVLNTSALQGPPSPESVPTIEVSGEESDAELPEADATVTASEYTFEAEGLKAGKTTIKFENAGAQPHHLEAFPILAGRTIEDVEEFAKTEKGKPPVNFEAGIGTEVLEGGTSQLVTLDLKAGNYALLCFISDRQGGPPHVAKGMIVEVEVE